MCHQSISLGQQNLKFIAKYLVETESRNHVIVSRFCGRKFHYPRFSWSCPNLALSLIYKYGAFCLVTFIFETLLQLQKPWDQNDFLYYFVHQAGAIEYHELGDGGHNKFKFVENIYQNGSKPPPYYQVLENTVNLFQAYFHLRETRKLI